MLSSRGAEVARWIETFLVHSVGDYFGQPFRLHPFQREFLDEMYRVDPNGRRHYRRALLGLPKGNGKTELAAAIAVAELGGPYAPPSPDVVIAAASFEQADLVFGSARTMIAQGPLAPFFDCFDTEVLRKDGPGRMYRVAAAAGTNDGGRPTCVVADELHEWVSGKQRVHLILANGLSKRRDGLELNISTAGADKDTLLGRLYATGMQVRAGEIPEAGFLFRWTDAPAGVDLADEAALRVAIRASNPAVAAGFLDEDRLVARSREIPPHEFLRYHLNIWTAPPTAWIPFDVWMALATADPVPDGIEICLGFDGSISRDSTALIGCTMTGHLFPVAIWERQGAGWVVPRAEVDAAVDMAFRRWKVRWMTCDPPRWEREVADWEARYPDHVMRFDTFVYQRMAPAVGRFHDAVRDGSLSHDGDPVLARHVGNARTKETRWGLVIEKETRDSPKRIDAAVAAVLAHLGISTPPIEKVPVDRRVRGWM